MITQKELIQRRTDFWKAWFLEESRHDLNMTIGLVKSMTNSIHVNNGEDDCSGLYHSSLLAEIRLGNFSSGHLEDLIDTLVDNLVREVCSLGNLEP